MIERKFVAQNFKEFQIKEYVRDTLSRVGLGDVKLQRTSLGERLVISASRPGLVVGRGGSTIQKLTSDLKHKFHLENPQIEIEEITDFSLDAGVIAEMIVGQLERFGTQRFKGIGHKTMENVMRAGALGVEILISGKIPSSRAKTWRFADGYMKKCGDLAITGVDTAKQFAKLKTGVVGVQVRIMPGTTKLPDQIRFSEEEYNEATSGAVVEEKSAAKVEESTDAKEEKAAKKETKKKTTKKKTTKTRSSEATGAQKQKVSSEAAKKKEETQSNEVASAPEGEAEEKKEEPVADDVPQVPEEKSVDEKTAAKKEASE